MQLSMMGQVCRNLHILSGSDVYFFKYIYFLLFILFLACHYSMYCMLVLINLSVMMMSITMLNNSPVSSLACSPVSTSWCNIHPV